MQNFEEQILALTNGKLPYFRAIAYRILASADDAEDAVQAALIKAWRKQTAWHGGSLSGWIAKIVIRESYDILRKQIREKKKLESCEPEENNDREDLRRLDEVVAQLPELYRETVHVALFSGLDTESAARELSCSPNTLYQRIHKAKQLIKKGFEQYEDN